MISNPSEYEPLILWTGTKHQKRHKIPIRNCGDKCNHSIKMSIKIETIKKIKIIKNLFIFRFKQEHMTGKTI